VRKKEVGESRARGCCKKKVGAQEEEERSEKREKNRTRLQASSGRRTAAERTRDR